MNEQWNSMEEFLLNHCTLKLLRLFLRATRDNDVLFYKQLNRKNVLCVCHWSQYAFKQVSESLILSFTLVSRHIV